MQVLKVHRLLSQLGKSAYEKSALLRNILQENSPILSVKFGKLGQMYTPL